MGMVNIEIWLFKELKGHYAELVLADKIPEYFGYIIVHELVHLLERNHNSRFVAYMDEFMPKWRLNRENLNKSPLSHEEWEY